MMSGRVTPGEHVDHLKLALYASELESLLAIQKKFNVLMDPAAVIQAIADETRRLTSAEAVLVYLLQKDQLEVAGISGRLGKNLLGHQVPQENSLAGKAVSLSKGFFVGDIHTGAFKYSWLQEKIKGTSFLVVPLVGKSGAIGAVVAAGSYPNQFRKEDLLLLELVLPAGSIALENAQRFVRTIHATIKRERRRFSQRVQAIASQTLFSVLLIADVLPRLIDRDPQQGRQRLEELREITRTAVSEVRDLVIDDH